MNCVHCGGTLAPHVGFVGGIVPTEGRRCVDCACFFVGDELAIQGPQCDG